MSLRNIKMAPYLTEDEDELAGGGGCGGNSWSFGGVWLPGGVSATREGVAGGAGCMVGDEADQCWASGIQWGRYIDILAAEIIKEFVNFYRNSYGFWAKQLIYWPFGYNLVYNG